METLLQIAAANAIGAGVLALLVALLSRLTERPVLIHALWVLVLLRLLAPPLIGLPVLPGGQQLLEAGIPGAGALIPAPQDPTFLEPGSEQTTAVPGRGDRLSLSAPVIISILWLASAAVLLLLASFRVSRFRRLLATAEPAPAELQNRAITLAEQIGISRCPTLCMTPGHISPVLWAVLGTPRILLPAELVACLSTEELDSLVAHELAHFHRRDHWVRYLEILAGILFWWYPVTWWARRALHAAEEQCCDAWVLSVLPGIARTYAESLFKTLEFVALAKHSPAPAVASGVGELQNMKKRMIMIFKQTRVQKRLSLANLLLLAVVGVIALSVYPTWAGRSVSAGAAPATGITTDSTEYSGAPITVNLVDADLKDVLNVFSQLTALNVVVYPGTGGTITANLEDVPWDQALANFISACRADYHLENNVLLIATPDLIATEKARRQEPGQEFTGDPISLVLKDVSVHDLLRTFSKLTGLQVKIDQDVVGLVTVTFVKVPWDQALHLILRANGLTYRLEGGVLSISRSTEPAAMNLYEAAATHYRSGARKKGTVLRPVTEMFLNEVWIEGTLRTEDDWLTLIQSDQGIAYIAKVGTRLLDAEVIRIEADRVIFAERVHGETSPAEHILTVGGS